MRRPPIQLPSVTFATGAYNTARPDASRVQNPTTANPEESMLKGVGDVMSYPQRRVVQMLTGTYQDPSAALGVQNPVGAFATDVVLDPANLIPAGVMAKLFGRGAKVAGAADESTALLHTVVKDKPRLTALHNTYETSINKVLDLGGLPAPSIAVLPENVPFNEFGPITLIGKKQLANPSMNRVFSDDIYSDVFYSAPNENFNLTDIVNEITKPKKDFFFETDLVNKSNVITDRRLTVWSPGNVRASRATEFKDLEEMRELSHKIVPLNSDYSRPNNLQNVVNKLEKYATENPTPAGIVFNRWAFDNNAYRALSTTTEDNIALSLKNSGFENVPENLIDEIKEAIRKDTEYTNYFESKPQRAVLFDEFAGALVPEDTTLDLIQRLKGTGLAVETYPNGNRFERLQDFRRRLNNQGMETLFTPAGFGLGVGAAMNNNRQQK